MLVRPSPSTPVGRSPPLVRPPSARRHVDLELVDPAGVHRRAAVRPRCRWGTARRAEPVAVPVHASSGAARSAYSGTDARAAGRHRVGRGLGGQAVERRQPQRAAAPVAVGTVSSRRVGGGHPDGVLLQDDAPEGQPRGEAVRARRTDAPASAPAPGRRARSGPVAGGRDRRRGADQQQRRSGHRRPGARRAVPPSRRRRTGGPRRRAAARPGRRRLQRGASRRRVGGRRRASPAGLQEAGQVVVARARPAAGGARGRPRARRQQRRSTTDGQRHEASRQDPEDDAERRARARPRGTSIAPSIAGAPAAVGPGTRSAGGVDLLRVAAQQHGDLVDDDVAHQVGEVVAVVRADLQRAPVDDDPRRHLAAVLAVRGQHPGQRHAAVVEHVGVEDDLVGAGVVDPRHVLDGELDAGQLPLPAALEVLDRVEDQVVELLGPAAGQRDLGRHQAAAQAAAVAVAAGAAPGGGVGGSSVGGDGLTAAAARGRGAGPVSVPTGSSCRMVRPTPETPACLLRSTARAGLLCLREEPVVRQSRRCSRSGCAQPAAATLTYVYAESTAVVGPLATFSEPHSYDLCEFHAERLTVPRGWEVVRHEIDLDDAGPTGDDLLALADAVREAARPEPPRDPADDGSGTRRGHLRVLPDLP